MKTTIKIFITLLIINCLGCEGNTTGMYRHKQDHEDKAAEQVQDNK